MMYKTYFAVRRAGHMISIKTRCKNGMNFGCTQFLRASINIFSLFVASIGFGCERGIVRTPLDIRGGYKVGIQVFSHSIMTKSPLKASEKNDHLVRKTRSYTLL